MEMRRADRVAPNARADGLVRATLSLGDAALRSSYVASIVRSWPLDVLAKALDTLCERAEQAETAAREVLVAVVDALNADGMNELVVRLREEAAGESLLSLERLVRHGTGDRSGAPASRAPKLPPPRATPIEIARGRPLTLGERKSLARRPDRQLMQRLLADPHPDVVRRCLSNPRLTEEDVVSLAAKRPGRAEVLSEIARSRWVRRPRVRMSLVLNPWTMLEMATRIAGLLLRHELVMVSRAANVSPGVRALCLELLARRPPVNGPSVPTVH